MFGALGFLGQLAALGRAPRGSAADLAKRVSRLPASEKERFKALRAEQKAKIDAARAAAQAEYEAFLVKFGLPPRPDYKKEREVVSAFVLGISAAAVGLETDGYKLRVNGREVASRDSIGSPFLKVCPGKFGEDKTSRRAANAALDVLGAGLRVDDRGSHAFLRASAGGGGGRLESENACYNVQVNRRIREAASEFSPESFGPRFMPGWQGENQQLELKFPGSKMNGLRRKSRRRSSRSKGRR